MLKKHSKKDHKKEEIVDLENQLKRALADYANLQKRVDEEKKLTLRFANAVLIAKFLDVLDNLETAQKTINSEGLELVMRKFREILANEGVEEIKTEGEEFDPNLHEGIASVEGEKPNQVAEVLQKGYTLNGKVLRPARVKVTTAKENG